MPQFRDVTALEIIWRNPWVRAVIYIVLTLFTLYVLWRFRTGYMFALQVAVLGFTVAYVLNPLVNLLGRLRISRAFSVIIVYIQLIILMVFGSGLITQVVRETGPLVERIPQGVEAITPWIERAYSRVGGLGDYLPDVFNQRFGLSEGNSENLVKGIETTVTGFLEDVLTRLNSLMENILNGSSSFLVSGLTKVASVTAQVILILLTSAYFLYDYPKFTANFKRFVPLRYKPLYEDITQKADTAIGGYIRGQLLITSALGVLVWIGLSLIGVPSALPISFLAALFNIVPYLGPIIGVIPAVLLGFTVSPWTALGAAIVFIAANQIEGNVLAPMILSKSTDLHPVTVLLGILAGAGMFGLVGALLAVPMLALGKILIEEYLLKRPAYVGDGIERDKFLNDDAA